MSRLVVPQSQRTHPTQWPSHNDLAAKALRKLAGPHVPASLKQLDRAVARAHREYDTAARQVQNAQTGRDDRSAPDREQPGVDGGDATVEANDIPVDEDLDEMVEAA